MLDEPLVLLAAPGTRLADWGHTEADQAARLRAAP